MLTPLTLTSFDNKQFRKTTNSGYTTNESEVCESALWLPPKKDAHQQLQNDGQHGDFH